MNTDSEKEIKQEKTCNCHNKDEKAAAESTVCCSSNDEGKKQGSDKIEIKRGFVGKVSLKSIKNPVKPDEHMSECCCSSQSSQNIDEKTQPANEQIHSCCSSKEGVKSIKNEVNKAKEPTQSCCGGSDQKSQPKEKYSSCCGTSESTQSYCSCCGGDNHSKKDTFWARRKGLIFLILSLISLIASFTVGEIESLHETFWMYIDFGFIAVILCGLPIMKRAVKNLIGGRKFSERITSPLLITISMIACIVLQILMWAGALSSDGHAHSYIFAAGEVAWLMALGSYIEEFTVKKARSGIERLINLSPVTAKVRINGELIEKPLSEIKVGDIVTILPNDMISVDGEIISGTTSVDQAVMTGESVPVDKTIGDVVFGGTWNKSGAIEVRVTKAEDEMTINKLRKIVEEAEGKKAPISKLADKFASVVIPAAVFLSILIFVLNFFTMGIDFVNAIVNGVTMLVVFCPCALALATPTAVAAGLGNATQKGILIKSGGALESLAKVGILAFDKTGTLTLGNIAVNQVITYGVDEKELLYYAGSAEMMSEHPIAKAITAYAQIQTELKVPTNTQSLIGIGVEAEIDGQNIIVRKWDKLKEDIDYSFAADDAMKLLSEGKTLAIVIKNNKLLGLIALADTVRDGAYECTRELKKMGISVAMLTGDNKYVAQNISAKIGIDNVYASLMPEDKLDVIEELKSKNKGLVGMVGDGVNDAPALAAADCSIAIGTLGSDVAIETADSALMSGDIRKLPLLLRLAKSMMTKIKINITISMTISFIAFLLSLFGVLNPVTGALVHNVSSVMVVLNSALLLRKE